MTSDRRAIPAHWQPTEKTIHRTFHTGTFVRGVEFVNAVKDLAETAHHHPDVILTYPTVIITLTTHDDGMVTMKDLALAAQINRVWEEQFSDAAA